MYFEELIVFYKYLPEVTEWNARSRVKLKGMVFDIATAKFEVNYVM